MENGKLEVGSKIQYVNKIIRMSDGSIMIARVLLDDRFQSETYLNVYRPMEIIHDYEGVFMRKWIPPSDDDVFSVPLAKIMNISNPSKKFIDKYGGFIDGEYSEYDFGASEDEDHGEEYAAPEEEKILH